ncbi:metalloprotease PmbA [bacterium]|nr:metalloprotease PmbA [bacterium]
MTAPNHYSTDPVDLSLPDAAELKARVQQALDDAKGDGIVGAAASLSVSAGLTVTVRGGDVEAIEFQRDRDLGVTIYRAGKAGLRSGSASTADLADDSLAEVVRRAKDIAQFTGEDACAGLPDAARMADPAAQPDLDQFHPWALSVAEAIELARSCEAAALAADPRIKQSEGVSVDTRASISVLGNSHGVVLAQRGTSHSLSCSAIAQAGDEMQSDYWYGASRLPGDIGAPQAIGERAARRAVGKLGGKPMATATMPVLFPAELARGLIGSFFGAISGGNLYRKSSFLLDAMDTLVFPPGLSIVQQPHVLRAAGSTAYDREGVVTTDRALVEDGHLRGWLLGSYSARKLGLASTGNAGGAFNVQVSAPAMTATDDALLAQMGDGLLLTDMMGHGSNLMTGDYSRGAAGYRVRNGQIAEPVNEVTVAGNLRDMFAAIGGVGSDVDHRGNVQTGALLVDGLVVAGS